jgi:Flp pilus assembly protein TadD
VASVAGALAVIALTVGLIVPQQRAEAIRHEMRRRIDRLAENPPAPAEEERLLREALAEFTRATELADCNGQTWADSAYAMSLLARHHREEMAIWGREAETAARRALGHGAVVPEFWWRLGVALDMQGRWTEGGAAFARALELAPHSALAWYYQAYHLSLKPAMEPLARAAVTTCLRLDPGNRAAETLREKLVARQ